MSTDTVTLFFALLAILAQISVAVTVVVAVGSLRSSAMRRWLNTLRREIGPQAVTMAAVVALTCTAGSLYLSEVAGFRPCRLCWYQRYAMYPLVVVAGLAAALRSRLLVWVGAGIAVVGASISSYHMLVERYPSLESSACDLYNPCSIIWVEHFGYLTIPTMALSGFVLIVTLLLIGRPLGPSTQAQEPT